MFPKLYAGWASSLASSSCTVCHFFQPFWAASLPPTLEPPHLFASLNSCPYFCREQRQQCLIFLRYSNRQTFAFVSILIYPDIFSRYISTYIFQDSYCSFLYLHIAFPSYSSWQMCLTLVQLITPASHLTLGQRTRPSPLLDC